MSFTSVFESIGAAVKKAAQKVVSVAESIFGKQQIEDFGKAAEGVLKSALGQIVVEVVGELTLQAQDGASKKDLAFSKIATAAKTAGIQASESLINLLIELAVSALKGNFPVS